MTSADVCTRSLENVGAGIGASLRSVDCAANQMAESSFNRLFGPYGSLGPELTILLTLFIAFIGFGLITGRLRIGLSSLTPKMVTLVLVVTFATSWIAFQSVFWNLAVGAPDEIAGLLMGTHGSATMIFADKLDVVMASLMHASGNTTLNANTSIFSPPGLLWTGGTMLLLGTVGVLATCKIALAVLMALGPLFIVAALFTPTRGLFAGWLKGVLMLALAPLFAVLAGSLMLELAAPVLASLQLTPGKIDVRPAMAFFMIGVVHLALMFLVLKVGTTMVSGWSVFGLAAGHERSDDTSSASAAARPAAPAALLATAAGRRTADTGGATRRDSRIAEAGKLAANDAAGDAYVRRETRLIANPATGSNAPALSRTRGIGNRFKSAPRRSTETRPS